MFHFIHRAAAPADASSLIPLLGGALQQMAVHVSSLLACIKTPEREVSKLYTVMRRALWATSQARQWRS